MLNSTKTWQDRFDEMSEINEFHGLPYDNLVDKAIKHFISNLRKRDMEALIGIMKDKFAPSDNFLTIDLIKDYYEK